MHKFIHRLYTCPVDNDVVHPFTANFPFLYRSDGRLIVSFGLADMDLSFNNDIEIQGKDTFAKNLGAFFNFFPFESDALHEPCHTVPE